MAERNHRPVDLHAYFGYRDAPAAIAWLERAIGFETTMSFPDDDGGVAHAELRLGDAVIVVFSDRDGYQRPPRKGDTSGSGTYLSVADPTQVDAVYEQAIRTGATAIWKPELNEWESYRCRIVDPEGFEWTIGTYRPGESSSEHDDDWSSSS